MEVADGGKKTIPVDRIDKLLILVAEPNTKKRTTKFVSVQQKGNRKRGRREEEGEEKGEEKKTSVGARLSSNEVGDHPFGPASNPVSYIYKKTKKEQVPS